MRLNRYIALCSDLSRRAADKAICDGRVMVNGHQADTTTVLKENDAVELDGQTIQPPTVLTTVMLNKPVDYVVSRDGQGSKTIYDLLPAELSSLNPVGRLDKNSSGLLLLTNDGNLANRLTHPQYQKTKIYEISLHTPLEPLHQQMISQFGITLTDGPSRLLLESLDDSRKKWRVTMHEGRNRQIRRTFSALGYEVIKLHRTNFGQYILPANLEKGSFKYLSE